MSNLKGGRWLVSLHNVWVWELGNLNAFMQILWERFKDPMAAWHTESHIHTLKQGKQPVLEYIQDFCSLSSHLPDWPKHMLVS